MGIIVKGKIEQDLQEYHDLEQDLHDYHDFTGLGIWCVGDRFGSPRGVAASEPIILKILKILKILLQTIGMARDRPSPYVKGRRFF